MFPVTVRAMTIAALLALLATPVHALEVRNARAPEPPPGAPVVAGYMEIRNDGDAAVRITGARSPAFANAGLHDTETDGDMTRMIPLEALEVPAGGRVTLEPRGRHLMLFTPQVEVTPGDRLPVTLETTAGDLEIELRVVERDQLDADRGAGTDH